MKCCSIWDYLVQLTSDNKVTVLITTHYIEEAKQAGVVSKSLIEYYTRVAKYTYLTHTCK